MEMSEGKADRALIIKVEQREITKAQGKYDKLATFLLPAPDSIAVCILSVLFDFL